MATLLLTDTRGQTRQNRSSRSLHLPITLTYPVTPMISFAVMMGQKQQKPIAPNPFGEILAPLATALEISSSDQQSDDRKWLLKPVHYASLNSCTGMPTGCTAKRTICCSCCRVDLWVSRC
jgi:hypothetical protein